MATSNGDLHRLLLLLHLIFSLGVFFPLALMGFSHTLPDVGKSDLYLISAIGHFYGLKLMKAVWHLVQFSLWKFHGICGLLFSLWIHAYEASFFLLDINILLSICKPFGFNSWNGLLLWRFGWPEGFLVIYSRFQSLEKKTLRGYNGSIVYFSCYFTLIFYRDILTRAWLSMVLYYFILRRCLPRLLPCRICHARLGVASNLGRCPLLSASCSLLSTIFLLVKVPMAETDASACRGFLCNFFEVIPRSSCDEDDNGTPKSAAREKFSNYNRIKKGTSIVDQGDLSEVVNKHLGFQDEFLLLVRCVRVTEKDIDCFLLKRKDHFERFRSRLSVAETPKRTKVSARQNVLCMGVTKPQGNLTALVFDRELSSYSSSWAEVEDPLLWILRSLHRITVWCKFHLCSNHGRRLLYPPRICYLSVDTIFGSDFWHLNELVHVFYNFLLERIKLVLFLNSGQLLLKIFEPAVKEFTRFSETCWQIFSLRFPSDERWFLQSRQHCTNPPLLLVANKESWYLHPRNWGVFSVGREFLRENNVKPPKFGRYFGSTPPTWGVFADSVVYLPGLQINHRLI